MKYLSLLLSPTWLLADVLKPEDRCKRTQIIKLLNSMYLSISLVSVISLVLYQFVWLRADIVKLSEDMYFVCILAWLWFAMSRCNEIFIAFLFDAIDKSNAVIEDKSNLTSSDRMVLSLKSYLELIFNFSIIYLLLPQSCFKDSAPKSILESIYFSGVTITTLGYGDIRPVHWFPQLLSVYEVFCGFILLVVCFAIYTGRIKSQQSGALDQPL